MRVFVTGATGFVGSAVVQDLIQAGHQVLGLSRSDDNTRKLVFMGAKAHRGDLTQFDTLMSGAKACDGVIHCGFNHDFSKFQQNCENDRRSIAALGDALAGTDKPFVITSGIGLLHSPNGALVTENDRPKKPATNPRVATEEAAEELMALGVNASVVRLPPSVHGIGDHGFVPMLIDLARRKNCAAYIGEGTNRWPAVHRADAASVYRLALEKAAPGSYYHAVADEGVAFREIAAVIGRRLNVPVESKNGEQVAAHFEWFQHFAAMNVPASSELTRAELGWQSKQIGLIADIDQPAYFEK